MNTHIGEIQCLKVGLGPGCCGGMPWGHFRLTIYFPTLTSHLCFQKHLWLTKFLSFHLLVLFSGSSFTPAHTAFSCEVPLSTANAILFFKTSQNPLIMGSDLMNHRKCSSFRAVKGIKQFSLSIPINFTSTKIFFPVKAEVPPSPLH